MQIFFSLGSITLDFGEKPEDGDDGWISVEERFPGLGMPVLVAMPDKPHALIASFDGYYWRFSDAIAKGVTHWRPLPKMPK